VAADAVLPSEASQAAGRSYLARVTARKDRVAALSMQTVQAQAAASAAYGARKDETYAHLKRLHQPTLVVNDTIVPTINSDILQQHTRTLSSSGTPTPTMVRTTNVQSCLSNTPSSSSPRSNPWRTS
jgi:hypothetical protein